MDKKKSIIREFDSNSNLNFISRNKNGAFSVFKTGQTPEEKGYSLRTNRLRKRPENRTLIPTLPPVILSESAIKTEEPEEEEELPETPKLTYQQLKERGFTGTRYDAELVSSQGLYEKFRESTMIIQPKSIVQIHQRSLRSTPDRIRKRCQVGRAASDTSSGISDDGSSSASGSGSDSGIETARYGFKLDFNNNFCSQVFLSVYKIFSHKTCGLYHTCA